EQAQSRLADAGLLAQATQVIATEPKGTVLAAEPDTGELDPGATVKLKVSAGYPELAFDDGEHILLADGADGSPRRRLRLAGGETQTQPAWTPDGELVYRGGYANAGRIWIADAGPTPSGGRPLTDGGYDDRRPAVSPDGTTVAFVRGASRGDHHRLCFVTL